MADGIPSLERLATKSGLVLLDHATNRLWAYNDTAGEVWDLFHEPLSEAGIADDKLYLVMALVVLAIAAMAVKQLRAGSIGQTLQALRGSEIAAQSIGISPTRARVTAFAISGFLAGLGGALLSIQQKNVNYASNFAPFAALFWLVVVISLGSRTIEGASYAGASFSLMDRIIFRGAFIAWILRSEELVPGFLPLSPKWRFVLFGLTTISFARHPEGLVEFGKRRAHLRMERLMSRRRPPGPGPGSRVRLGCG